MKGYKATDKDLKCRDFQFEIGKWYEHEGDLSTCQSGFHFCEQPSGPWAYYSDPNTRIFEIEADDVLDVPFEPGADFKRVARRIKFVKEITPPKESGSNTGSRNTGFWNTGDGNIGDANAGSGNTGSRNTGFWNTGGGNTGSWNTGFWNTGSRNTGNGNAGSRNIGFWNTGDGNIGSWNTGSGNVTNYSAGFFCMEEPKVITFDKQTKYTHEEFRVKFPEYWELCDALSKDDEILIEPYKKIPGITKAKLKKLHDKFITARKDKK